MTNTMTLRCLVTQARFWNNLFQLSLFVFSRKLNTGHTSSFGITNERKQVASANCHLKMKKKQHLNKWLMVFYHDFYFFHTGMTNHIYFIRYKSFVPNLLEL